MKNLPLFSELFLAFRIEHSMSLAVCESRDKLSSPDKSLEVANLSKSTQSNRRPFHVLKASSQPGYPCFQAAFEEASDKYDSCQWNNSCTQGSPARKSWISLSPRPPKLAKCFRFFEFCGLITTSILALLGSRHPFTLCYTNILVWFLHWIKRKGITSELLTGNKHICLYVREK